MQVGEDSYFCLHYRHEGRKLLLALNDIYHHQFCYHYSTPPPFNISIIVADATACTHITTFIALSTYRQMHAHNKMPEF